MSVVSLKGHSSWSTYCRCFVSRSNCDRILFSEKCSGGILQRWTAHTAMHIKIKIGEHYPRLPGAPPGHIHQKVVTLQRFSWKWQFKRTFITTLQVRRQKMFNRNAIMIYNFHKCNCKYRNFYVKTNRSKKWINISYVDTTLFHIDFATSLVSNMWRLQDTHKSD